MIILGNVNLAEENYNLCLVLIVILCRFQMHFFHIEALLQKLLDSFKASSLTSPLHVVVTVYSVLQDQATELIMKNPYEAFKEF